MSKGFHTKGREINPFTKDAEDLLGLAEQFECEPQDFWRHQGYDLRFVCEAAYAAMRIAANEPEKPSTGIDFADMIFLPLVKGWTAGRYDLGVVDETQDMTMAQLHSSKPFCRPAHVSPWSGMIAKPSMVFAAQTVALLTDCVKNLTLSS